MLFYRLALDFRQELRWKLSASRSVAEAICTADSSCSQKMIIEKLQTMSKDYTSSEITSSDKSDAEIVASTLSASVSMLWKGWEATILGSSERSVVLDSLFRYWDPLSTDDDKTTEPVDTVESSGPISCLENEIDRVLSIPLLLDDDGAFKSDVVSNGDVLHNSPAQPSKPTSILQTHQEGVLRKVQFLNRLGFGAGVYGKAFVGKTVALCFLIQDWLSKPSEHASSVTSDRSADSVMSSLRKKIVILVAARKCIFRWISELRRLQSMFAAVLWSSRFNASEHKFAGSTVMVVPLECLQVFLASNFLNKLMSEDGSLSTPTLNGILLDVRCQDPIDHNSLNPKRDTFQSSLFKLTSQLSVSFANRCILSELSFLSDSHLQLLNFLMPKTSFNQWTQKYMPQSQSDEDSTIAQHPINRNTLVQLLFNLSIHLEAPVSIESIANTQVCRHLCYTL